MGKCAVLRVLIVLGSFCVASAAVSGEMYFTPAVVFTDDDEVRGADDAVNGGQASLGWVLSNRISIEGMIGSSDLGGPNDLSISEGSLNLLVSLSPDTRLSPYLIGGIGMMKTDFNGTESENSTLGNAGLGLKYRFGESPVSLRLEYRARFETANTLTFVDRITSLGLQFGFGGKEAPISTPPVQVDGDSDNDGVPDSRDECPDTVRGVTVDARGCALDSDGDRVTDDHDSCPNTVRGAAVDARGCELDSDNDRVVDRLDKCPNTSAGVRVDINGCEIREVIDLPGVNFESNSDMLLPGTENVLADAAATLRMNQDLIVEVAGHTDSNGSADHNEGLSERRAVTVRDYLLSRGANPANVTAKGYGEVEPVADNTSAEGRARNRRVELRILNR